MLGKEPLSLNPSNTFWEERRLIKAADNVVEKWSRVLLKQHINGHGFEMKCSIFTYGCKVQLSMYCPYTSLKYPSCCAVSVRLEKHRSCVLTCLNNYVKKKGGKKKR